MQIRLYAGRLGSTTLLETPGHHAIHDNDARLASSLEVRSLRSLDDSRSLGRQTFSVYAFVRMHGN